MKIIISGDDRQLFMLVFRAGVAQTELNARYGAGTDRASEHYKAESFARVMDSALFYGATIVIE